MKKISPILLVGFLITTPLVGQRISTDPSNPVNEERPELVNNFNWMDRLINVYHPDGGYVDGSNNPILLGNPYYEREEYQNHFNLFNYDLGLPPSEEAGKLYFHPRDGWELLHKNNGFGPDETTLITDPLINRVGPYFLLYNRYTGKLRVLASFDGLGLNDNIVTTLKFKNPTPGAPNLAYNGLFNNYGLTSQPLDRQTDVVEISEVSKAAISRGFISSDFQMSYDACTCDNQSELIADFASLNTASMDLEGRLIATSVPLDGSGNSPLLNRRDFLTSVYKDGFTVNGGMLTYKNIDALVEKYKTPKLSLFEKASLAVIKGAINGVAKAVDKTVINKGAAVVFNDLFGDLPFYKDQESVGLGLLAAGAKSLTAELFPKHSVPNIGFIEGEMALTGTLEDETLFNNGSINLAVPGSKESENVLWQFYPAYNKPLGLFALLETPEVSRFKEVQGRGNGVENLFYIYQFQNAKYAFNPNARVNVENTRVLGALELVMSLNDETLTLSQKNHRYRRNKNLQLVPNASEEENIFITPFVPIEQLQDVMPRQMYKKDCERDLDRGQDCDRSEDYTISVTVNLKILIEYEFHENEYGEKNRTIQVYTYPVKINQVDALDDYQDLTLIPTNWSSTNDFILAEPTQHRNEVWDNIEISHTVGVASNVAGKQTYNANSIVLSPGAHIQPDVTLRAGLPLPDRPPIPPKDQGYVTNFCNTLYRGNEYSGTAGSNASVVAMESPQLQVEDEEHLSKGIIIYPNPNSGAFTISFEEPATSCQRIKILSSYNRVVYERSLESTEIYNGINMNSLPSGFYYAKFYFKNEILTKRIWIQ
ncbi:MAG: T9SS type A sorting domain-containing protein [Cytophagales bacterium]|nr:T9SS type A sorting domain-containing protein [Cytophagales bacterium]